VCGTAAAERRTVIVPDVERFPGHIACDARAKSEIVVPVFDQASQLIAVLDIDSEKRATFDQEDASGLERMMGWFAGQGRG
jgi:GAF domain-containing protein